MFITLQACTNLETVFVNLVHLEEFTSGVLQKFTSCNYIRLPEQCKLNTLKYMQPFVDGHLSFYESFAEACMGRKNSIS